MGAVSQRSEKLVDAEALESVRSMTSGAAWVVASRIALLVSSAGVSVVIAHALGPSGTGRVAIAVAFFGFVSLLATVGLDIGVTWQMIRRRWPQERAFAATQRVAAVVGLLGAAAGLGAYALGSQSFHGPSSPAMLPVLLALPFALSWMFGAGVALAGNHYELAFGLPGLQAIAYFVAIAALAPTLGVAGALLGILVSHAVTAIALWLAPRRDPHASRVEAPTDDRRQLVGAIAFGLKPYLANVLQMINFRVDLFIVAAYATHSQVGYYALAVALTLPLWMIPGSLGIVLYQRVASRDPIRGETPDLEGRTLRHTTVLVAVGCGVLALILVLLVTVVFGSRFAPVTEPGLILLPGSAALAFFRVFSGAITGRGRPQDVLVTTMLTTPLTIVLYFVLIPAYRINGAALASTISYLSSAVLLGYFLRRAHQRPLLPLLIPGRRELTDYRDLSDRVRALVRESL